MEIVDIIILIFGCIVSYLLGGISIARLITKKKNDDISSEGSGNPGTMNMLRTHGMFMGLLTLLCDALKGVIPALFGLLYFQQYDISLGYLALYLFGLFAVIGHIFPVYHKFKGGKGIATTFGVFMVADPITTLILFAILFVALYFIRIGSVVSLLFITINVIVQLFKSYIEDMWVTLIPMLLIVIIDIWAHRQNLLRLIDNRENPADLQAGLMKDIEKLKSKKAKKLEKNEQKQEKIEKKFNTKITRKEDKVNKRIEKINQKSVSSQAKSKISKPTKRKIAPTDN